MYLCVSVLVYVIVYLCVCVCMLIWTGAYVRQPEDNLECYSSDTVHLIFNEIGSLTNLEFTEQAKLVGHQVLGFHLPRPGNTSA